MQPRTICKRCPRTRDERRSVVKPADAALILLVVRVGHHSRRRLASSPPTPFLRSSFILATALVIASASCRCSSNKYPAFTSFATISLVVGWDSGTEMTPPTSHLWLGIIMLRYRCANRAGPDAELDRTKDIHATKQLPNVSGQTARQSGITAARRCKQS